MNGLQKPGHVVSLNELTCCLCFPAHKRIRKPSKRLIEWTEEYDQIFSVRKKTKKPVQSIGKVKKKKKYARYWSLLTEPFLSQGLFPQETLPVIPETEPLSPLDKVAIEEPSLSLLPEIQTPPPEEVATAPSELQLPSTENANAQEAAILSIETLTPPPDVDPAALGGLVKVPGKAASSRLTPCHVKAQVSTSSMSCSAASCIDLVFHLQQAPLCWAGSGKGNPLRRSWSTVWRQRLPLCPRRRSVIDERFHLFIFTGNYILADT